MCHISSYSRSILEWLIRVITSYFLRWIQHNIWFIRGSNWLEHFMITVAFGCRHLVNTLATKGPQSGKHEDSLYRGSCLTHLLKESLGGNSKLTVLCAISPDKK